MDIMGDSSCNLTIRMRQSLHRQIARRAFEAEMSIKGFVLKALQAQGVEVCDDEITDRRRRQLVDAA